MTAIIEQARAGLCRALEEWKNAGGKVEDVVRALDALVDARIREANILNEPVRLGTFGGPPR